VTWSIVAVDPVTREVGVAAATCTWGVETIRGVVPGRGVLAAQAMTNLRARDEAVKALAAGRSVEEVLCAAREACALGGRAWKDQQLAVAVLDPEPRAVVYTGDDTFAWSGSRGAQAVSVQGNMLRGAEVVDVAFRAFASEEPRADGRPPDLAERLMRGIEAGAEVGGDNRCPFECPAQTAFLAVARPDEPDDEDPALYLVAPKAWGPRSARLHVVPPEWKPGDPKPVKTLIQLLESIRA
jgi:uncharacterized Ntn-hydrolase superfamily protein